MDSQTRDTPSILLRELSTHSEYAQLEKASLLMHVLGTMTVDASVVNYFLACFATALSSS
jgi:hypothetical protein